MLKKIVIGSLLISAMSYVSAAPSQLNNTQYKQMDTAIVKSNSTESWEIKPPYDGWGFGVWENDHRIQKIIVHVNRMLSNSNERFEAVKLSCNGTEFIIDEGETVVCERSLDNHAGIELVKDYKHTKLRSEGTVRFIMEDI